MIQHGLVVDGASLSLALRGHEKLFMEVCKNCSAVLCCRMAPLQKAKVKLVNTQQPAQLKYIVLRQFEMSIKIPLFMYKQGILMDISNHLFLGV